MSLGFVTSIARIVFIAFFKSAFFLLAFPLAIPPFRASIFRSSTVNVLVGFKFFVPALILFSVKSSRPFCPFLGCFVLVF
nr:MAG TPA: hypothetical protein [Caudoviricetes sp.]